MLSFTEVTAFKLASESVRRSEAMLATAQEIAHLGSWELDVAAGLLVRPGGVVPGLGYPAVGCPGLLVELPGGLAAAASADLERRYAALADAAATSPDADAFRIDVYVRPGAPLLPWRADGMLPLRTRRIGRWVLCLTPGEAGCFDLAARRGRITLRPPGHAGKCPRVLVGWGAAQRGGVLLAAVGGGR